MMKDKIDWRIVITGIICLTILEGMALFNGINGTLFTIIASIIALAIGVAIPRSLVK